MKQVIFGAALCGAALAAATAANADAGTYDFLYGSTNALVLGPTGIPTPNAAYISDVLNLYLEPNGYGGTTATTVALTTPETSDFLSSVPQGEAILVNAVLADYNAGDMGCDASGACSDPLTIFTYSQSSLDAALAEQQLAAHHIPTDALRFVMLGANNSVVPNDLYPTDIYNIHGDIYAEPGSLGASWQNFILGLELHEAYLGLTPAEVDSATTVVDGMTTINDIPTLTSTELWDALLNALRAA
ncbi:alpha/beta hydrolase family protein [[Mycobacterium] crassicus]|uniref:PE-PPE domain-containing protein n=1 Tax=[Mycobacterium] crassicus TaxID=2872309 RepID=A0ABU5XER7_9MYCO|nr:PE-PPE domain-containing protein [Mycolicibacter sp. MYC098]MEB3020800.1 PE-PPE domain-containing protein [Mycolicibacter sp. MYC098]